MKRIFCMVLVLMLALSCVSAFAATTRTIYSATDVKVDVQISTQLKYYYTWLVPGDDEDMSRGKTEWGKVGLHVSKFGTGAKAVKLYVNSENSFNLVHEKKSSNKIPYTVSVGDIADITTNSTATMIDGKSAYFIMKTSSTANKKQCYYTIGDVPNECGWYRDTVTFYCISE